LGGKASAEYYRQWRAAHPEYRKRQNELRKKRRAEKGREDRQREYANQRVQRRRKNGDNGHLLESSVVRKARELVLQRRKPDIRNDLYNDAFEDLVGEVVLALCEGKDPGECMDVWTKEDNAWKYRRAPLLVYP
jgi:hypothetical protein